MQATHRADETVRALERARATPPRTLGERIYFERVLRPRLDREISQIVARETD